MNRPLVATSLCAAWGAPIAARAIDGISLEAGSNNDVTDIGFHLLSEHRVSAARDMSTNFQLGDHIGAGTRFGARQELDFGLRFQHLSNADLKRPDPGINFVELRFEYHR